MPRLELKSKLNTKRIDEVRKSLDKGRPKYDGKKSAKR